MSVTTAVDRLTAEVPSFSRRPHERGATWSDDRNPHHHPVRRSAPADGRAVDSRGRICGLSVGRDRGGAVHDAVGTSVPHPLPARRPSPVDHRVGTRQDERWLTDIVLKLAFTRREHRSPQFVLDLQQWLCLDGFHSALQFRIIRFYGFEILRAALLIAFASTTPCVPLRGCRAGKSALVGARCVDSNSLSWMLANVVPGLLVHREAS